MTSWPTKKLGEAVYFQEGPGLRTFQFKPAGIRVINVANVREGFLDLLKTKFLDPAEMKQKYKHFLVKEGDILVSTSGTIGRVAWVEKENLPLMLNTSVVRFHTLDEKVLLNRFLLYFLSGSLFRNELLKYKTGVAIFNVGPSHIKKIRIPLPPLATQKQIVERMDKIVEAQKLNDELIQKSDELFQSLLHKELNPTSKDWEVKRLGDIIKPQYGYTASAKDSGNYRFIRITDINEDGDLRDDKKYVTLGRDEVKDYQLQNGDLLLARTGATFGKILYFKENEPSIFASFLIRLNPDTSIDPFYIWLFSRSQSYWRQAKSLMTGSGQPQFNANKLKQIKILLPPLKIQKQIVAKLSAAQEYKKQLLEQKLKLKELFDSVLHKSMNSQRIPKVVLRRAQDTTGQALRPPSQGRGPTRGRVNGQARREK